MKKITIIFALLTFSSIGFSQSIGINSTGANPDPSAFVDIVSTDKGLLIPRLDSTQRVTIVNPATGLLVFDTDYNLFWFYNGTSWTSIKNKNVLSDNDDDTKIQVEKNADEDKIRFTTEGYEMASLDGQTFNLGAPDGSVFIGKGAGKNDNGNTNGIIALGTDALRNNISGVSNIGIGAHTLYNTFDKGDNTAVGDSNLYFNTIGQYKAANSANNTAIGSKSQVYNTTGAQNTSTGSHSLYSNTDGSNNSAIGNYALYANNTGSNNTATGSFSLTSNTTGFANTAIGARALEDNLDGDKNTAIGYYALSDNISGESNIAVGDYSLRENETGNYNYAVGGQALRLNVSGSQNSAIGYKSLYSNKADNNNAFGDHALYSNTLGTENTAIGHRALYSNTTISNIVAIGDSSLFYNGIGASGDDATQNTAVGSKALKLNDVGKLNTAVGSQSLSSNTYGTRNVGVGAETLKLNNGGYSNTAIGTNTLENNNNGNSNTAIGYAALNKNESGNRNTAVGYLASQDNLNGLNNVTLGYSADANNVSGNFNTILGYQAGRYNQAHSKSGNVFIGYQAGYDETTDNKLYIENSNSPTPLLYGDFDTDLLRINGELNVNNAYSFPTADGSTNQILTTDGSGNISWSDKSPAYWIEGSNPDIYYSAGNVGVGHNNPSSLLHVNTSAPFTEVVDFTSGTLGGGDDLLNLTIGAGSEDDAQIIECKRGGAFAFKVNGNGQTAIGNINIVDDFMLTIDEGENGNGAYIAGNTQFAQLSSADHILDVIPGNSTPGQGRTGIRFGADENLLSSYVVKNDSVDFTLTWESLGFEFERMRINSFGRIEFDEGAFVLDPNVGGNSRFITDEIEIRGGSDLSEHFDIATTAVTAQPGMVVSIDPNHAGKLTISEEAYDKKVAGIISGANGIKTGVFMGQKGSIADGQYPIALTGRVYVYANQEGGIIQPGDLLTSSSTSGFAMKSTDSNKAQGAIIGKAMTAIDENGFVLVLVNLQ